MSADERRSGDGQTPAQPAPPAVERTEPSGREVKTPPSPANPTGGAKTKDVTPPRTK